MSIRASVARGWGFAKQAGHVGQLAHRGTVTLSWEEVEQAGRPVGLTNQRASFSFLFKAK